MKKLLLVILLALSSFNLFAQKAVPLDSVVWVIGSVIPTCAIARPDSSGWIDVNDSLPRTGQNVLTCVKLCYRFMPDLPRECHSFHYVTSYDGLNLPYDFNLHEIRDHNYGTEQVVEVTHWQPLPAKPKDK